MRGLWAGISGIIEGTEDPYQRAKIEIFEEVGLLENSFVFIKSSPSIIISSPQYENHQWTVFPFMFSVKEPTLKLNWENSEFRWVAIDEIPNYKTVPNLDKVLASLL